MHMQSDPLGIIYQRRTWWAQTSSTTKVVQRHGNSAKIVWWKSSRMWKFGISWHYMPNM